MKTLLLTVASGLVILPATALALEIPQNVSRYSDVRPLSADAPAIELLAQLDVLRGIGAERFGTSRLIRRGDFRSAAEKAARVAPSSQPIGWPLRPVQYDEALKILTTLFGYDLPEGKFRDWGEPYYRSAAARGVDLPLRMQFDRRLTRAMAARLIGAFIAEREGELEALRKVEAGVLSGMAPHPPLSASQASSSASNSSSSSSSSSSEVTSTPMTLSATSHFLFPGEVSAPIADITVPASADERFLAVARVKLVREVLSINALEVIDDKGTVLATLRRRQTTDQPDYRMTYEADISLENQKSIPPGPLKKLSLRAVLKQKGEGGISGELIEVRSIQLTLRGQSPSSTESLAGLAPFPKHQTAFSRIRRVERTAPLQAPIEVGSSKLVNAFRVHAEGLPDVPSSLRHLVFSMMAHENVLTQNWILRHGALSMPCYQNLDERTVSCPGLERILPAIPAGGLDLELRADIAFINPQAEALLQLDLSSSGAPDVFGSIEWTDGSSTFKWMEGPPTVMTGTQLSN